MYSVLERTLKGARRNVARTTQVVGECGFVQVCGAVL